MFFSKFVADCVTDKHCKGAKLCEGFKCKRPGKTAVLANPNYFKNFWKCLSVWEGGKGITWVDFSLVQAAGLSEPPF